MLVIKVKSKLFTQRHLHAFAILISSYIDTAGYWYRYSQITCNCVIYYAKFLLNHSMFTQNLMTAEILKET